jgi:hypothetical protein
MRFVRPQGSTPGLVTTKGHSGRSHHPKRTETPVRFVGVDGEGMTVNGEHRYVLFGVGSQQIENPDGLRWREVFEFLYQQRQPHTAHVGFFLGYDFTQIFKTLPEERARMLLTSEGKALRKHRIPGKVPHPVECADWQFDVLGMKRLRIRPKGCQCPVASCKCEHEPWLYVCDVGSYFQASFLTVVDPKNWSYGQAIVSDDEFEILQEGKIRRSTAVLDGEMRKYNVLENEVLARVMGTLDTGLHQIGIHLSPSKWFGPGQAAQAWLKNEKVPTGEQIRSTVPVWFLEAARASYYGGWFELFMHGIVPGTSHEYDINSAYPSVIAQLPCLLHGKYSYGEGLPPREADNGLCLVYAKVWSPGMPDRLRTQHIGAMLHRDHSGRILRPLATEGWFWWSELRSAYDAGLVRWFNHGRQQALRWVMYEPCDCPPPMANVAKLYLERLRVGKKTPLGKAAKVVYNSDYGKFAQSIGDPVFGNAVYASRITSECRRMILDAIASHPDGMSGVAMVATDAVYFLSPHPRLVLSENMGEWDYTSRENLTLFKPGVYWDDDTRRRIFEGKSPHFKARGFKASDFVRQISQVDRVFEEWEENPGEWPSVEFEPTFAMVTALQALRRNDWTLAGVVQRGPVRQTRRDVR